MHSYIARHLQRNIVALCLQLPELLHVELPLRPTELLTDRQVRRVSWVTVEGLGANMRKQSRQFLVRLNQPAALKGSR